MTLKPKKTFKYKMTAKVYAVGPGNTVGALLSTSTDTMKIPFRPTFNPSCPKADEGRGYGPNCDIGGFLATVTFKHFTPVIVLPTKAIILLEGSNENPPEDILNVGLQSSYKELIPPNEYIAEPPANKGIPAIGGNPVPNGVYLNGVLNEEEWLGWQPVFEVFAY